MSLPCLPSLYTVNTPHSAFFWLLLVSPFSHFIFRFHLPTIYFTAIRPGRPEGVAPRDGIGLRGTVILDAGGSVGRQSILCERSEVVGKAARSKFIINSSEPSWRVTVRQVGSKCFLRPLGHRILQHPSKEAAVTTPALQIWKPRAQTA